MIFGSKVGIPPIAATRLQRWALMLSAYNYTIVYKPGVSHANEDGLSRLPIDQEKPSGAELQNVSFNLYQLSMLPLTAKQLRVASRTDPELARVLHFTLKGRVAFFASRSTS